MSKETIGKIASIVLAAVVALLGVFGYDVGVIQPREQLLESPAMMGERGLGTNRFRNPVSFEQAVTMDQTLAVAGAQTMSGQVTIGDGGDTVAVNSSDWDISTTGVMTGIGAITADGLITGTAGAAISGATTSINASSNFGTNINTGTSSGALALGGGSGTVAVNSSDWDINATGDMTGIGGITADGTVNLSGSLLGAGALFSGQVDMRSTVVMTGTNAAGAGFNPIDYTATALAMTDGDDFTVIDINLTNGNHTGTTSAVQAIDIAGITADAEATETAVKIAAGWDYGLDLDGNVVVLGADGGVTLDETSDDVLTLGFGAGAGKLNVTTGNLAVGAGTPDMTLNGEDAYVTGTFEADGNARFDGTLTASSTGYFAGTVTIANAGANQMLFEGTTADESETILAVTDPTADRSITLPDASGTVALSTEGGYFFSLTADAVAQVGDLVMPDAGTALRFDVNTGSATMPLGVLGGTGPSAQGSSYPIVFAGLGRCAIQEDAAVTFAHWLIVSATAGKCNDSATITTIGLNVGKALESSPVSNTIDPAGCTGSAGCINTALNTPNTGPAGQITLAADVAAQGWVVGDPVIYWNSGGTTPTGLTDGKVYFLASVSTTNVTLSATKGGAVVVPSAQGDDATQYLQKLPLAVIQLN